MARPDPALLDPARYPHHATLQTRFQDLDPLGHLNNVAIAALFETARVQFNTAIGLRDAFEHRFVVARLDINYLAEGQFPADVVVSSGVVAIGTRSWTMACVAHQADVAIATAEVVLVIARPATELPAAFRAAFERGRMIAG